LTIKTRKTACDWTER